MSNTMRRNVLWLLRPRTAPDYASLHRGYAFSTFIHSAVTILGVYA